MDLHCVINCVLTDLLHRICSPTLDYMHRDFPSKFSVGDKTFLGPCKRHRKRANCDIKLALQLLALGRVLSDNFDRRWTDLFLHPFGSQLLLRLLFHNVVRARDQGPLARRMHRISLVNQV